MQRENTIVLRPRFKKELNEANETVLKRFEDSKHTQSNFIITRLDNHVFIKYPKKDSNFWSPQLHLEIDEVSAKSSLLHGLFGPNPTVWTMFMFLHFLVASTFIAFGIWAFVNWNLKETFTLQISLMILMIIIWLALYIAGRIGRDSSKKEMYKLRDFMEHILKEKSLS